MAFVFRAFPVGLFFILSSCNASPEMTLDKLLDLHAEARGGKTALENVNTIEARVDITEPTFAVEGYYRASRDGKMRIDIFADGQRVFTEALNGEAGWQMFDDGEIADLSPEGEAALRRGVVSNLYGLHELPGLGYDLKLIGERERNGGVFWEIEKTAPDGFGEHLFLDKDTYLVMSEVETSALHPDIDSTQTPQETFYSDFRSSGGVLYPYTSEKRNLATGEIMQQTVATMHKTNPELEAGQFERPNDL